MQTPTSSPNAVTESSFIGPQQPEPGLTSPIGDPDKRSPKPSPSRPKRKLWKRALRVLLILALLPHIYLLILKFLPVPVTLTMTGRALAGEDVRRDWTRLEDISPHLIDSVIGAEDSLFCTHSGIDWEATRDVIDAEGAPKRGASTITQQTAKNVFFWNGGGYVRKAGEAYFALLIDTVWGKRRVMEVYLNVAEWGDGLFGAEAAAQARFGKSASELTAREAALLAAVLPSPRKWRVDPPGPYVAGRASTLQTRAATVRNSAFNACLKN